MTHRVDGNQNQIIEELKQAGINVANTSQVGNGFPDTVICYKGINILLEIKMPGKDLRGNQRDFFDNWMGPIIVGYSTEDIINKCYEIAKG